MEIITIILLISIVLVIGYIIYLYYINSTILPSSPYISDSDIPISSPYISESERSIAQIGEKCGGNMTNAKMCASGLTCTNIGSPRLIGDIGGICVKN
jgi:hypothetical protein